jgi:hypothetical protein
MSQPESRFYTTLQYQEFLDDNENYCVNSESNRVFAKVIKSGYSKHMTNKNPTHNKFFVRISQDKKLYDPFPKYSVSDNRASFIDKVCRDNNSYKEVTDSIFSMYLNYLKTENIMWLNKAQREMNNYR